MKLTKLIENKRNSSNIFWIFLARSKDILWKIINSYKSQYIISLIGGVFLKKKLKDLKTYCMFVGYPRSGHSLIGSILDAHPNMIISHELNALKYIEHGFGKYQVYYSILRNSKNFNKINRKHTGYNYFVNNGWHAKFSKLLIIGDKMGGGSSHLIEEKPWLMEKLFKINKNINLKLIHVIRNPYDNITTISKRENISLEEAIDWYFFLVDVVQNIKTKKDKYNIIDVKHEHFIKNPQEELKRLCIFLSVEPYSDYLNDCGKLVWKTPHQTRSQANWTPELIQTVKSKITNIDFLKDYSYNI